MKNSIFSISPYFHNGFWVFDDASVGLVKEPFVMGVPEMIESLLAKKGLTGKAFSVLHSASGIPDPDLILDRQESESGGTWYSCKETGLKGWFCPALFLYYPVAPKKLYIQLIPIKTSKPTFKK